MIRIKDIAWAAGLIEGEGSFSVYTGRYSSPRISVGMTDADVVARLLDVFQLGALHVRLKNAGFENSKPIWFWRVNSKNAIAVAMTILPFLGERRKARAIEMIRAWRIAKLGRNKHSTDIPWKQRLAS